MPKSAAKRFEATLEHDSTPLKWVIVRIPFDAAKLWGKRGQIRVKGDINGFPFATSLFPTGDGKHTLLVNKKMQKGGRAGPGSTARFRLEPDTAERPILIPQELEKYLAEDRTFRRWFEQFNPSMRREIGKWVSEVKNPEARARRAEQIAERLVAAMEAEHDLPPILRAAFARDARAEQGWKRMTAAQRRIHLLGIFGYRSPESRARRLAKMMEFARKVAERGRELS
jgi:uncharacterized protein DUF1905/bacteriocin resistance YdeI/OmpD-like protein